jgi:septum formation protein
VTLILASRSEARQAMLRQAGLAFQALPANVDEGAVKASMRAEGATPAQAAAALALLKAQRISSRAGDALVIGADQILVCDERWFDKPADRADAEAQLRALRGRAHMLATAAVVARNGARLWGHVEQPRLVMRAFSDAALAAHLDAMGDAVTGTVGGYMLEGASIGLFAKVEGDWFSMLGMPLLPLLGFLRQHGAIAA